MREFVRVCLYACVFVCVEVGGERDWERWVDIFTQTSKVEETRREIIERKRRR